MVDDTFTSAMHGSAARVSRGSMRLVLGVALAKLVLNVAFHGRYGYFRDELYYIACSDHLAWGYVDHPPLSILILAVTRRLLGDSLDAIRFPAAVAGAVTVVLTALMARRLGGGRFAQVLAAAAAALSPVVLANGARYFSMNAFDLMFWALGAHVLLSILVDGKEKWWLLYGLVAGLGVMNKYSMLFFGFGAVGGLLLTSRRRELLRPWIWLGGLVAAVIVLPHGIWEIRHHFPSAEFIHNASTQKNAAISIGGFLVEQANMTGFGQTLLWLLGLAFFMRVGPRPARVFAWMFPIVTAVMIAGNSKAYYLTPIYFPYWAAGAVAVEMLARKPRLAWSKYAVPVLLAAFSLVSMPFAIPVLPVDAFVRYQKALGQTPKQEERSALADLPQFYADMFGWEEMVAKVAAVYHALSPEEQRHCVIYARNYGEAAAIDFFGKRYGLPRCTCAHNSYWYWGPRDYTGDVMLVLGSNGRGDLEHFRSVEPAGKVGTEYSRRDEHFTIWICKGLLLGNLKDVWPRLKKFS